MLKQEIILVNLTRDVMLDMNFTFLCLVISLWFASTVYAKKRYKNKSESFGLTKDRCKQSIGSSTDPNRHQTVVCRGYCIARLDSNANTLRQLYNKDVLCYMDKDKNPICKSAPRLNRRSAVSNNLPSHDPYIPRTNPILYNCTHLDCRVLNLESISQLVFPSSQLKSCFKQADVYECETIRYNNFKPIDKLLFLANHIPKKSFYLADCLVYTNGERVCHKKDNVDSYAELVDTGTIARPREPNVLSQDEFICEEGEDKEVNCDLDLLVPFEDGLRLKEAGKISDDILLKTGTYVVILQRNCIETWCGFSGRIMPTRRSRYEPPGGKTYRCYYAKKQQICKELIGNDVLHNNRNWLNV